MNDSYTTSGCTETLILLATPHYLMTGQVFPWNTVKHFNGMKAQ